MDEQIYQCTVCGTRMTFRKGDTVPSCCGKAMEPLPACISVPHPEMVRDHEGDEPCDDGVGTNAPGPKPEE